MHQNGLEQRIKHINCIDKIHISIVKTKKYVFYVYIIKDKAYDAMADFVYRNFKLNQMIVVEGKIRTDKIVKS